jgi:putative aldouronate transport system substrate-binding protein
MKKFKKAAVATVSVAMAGIMAVGIAGCNSTREPIETITTSADATKLVEYLNTQLGLSTRTTAVQSAWKRAQSNWSAISSSNNIVAATENPYLYNYTKSTAVSGYETSNSGGSGMTGGVTLGISIGHNSNITGVFYDSITGSATLPGGYVAATGKIKPAWYAMEKALGINFDNQYTNAATSANLTELKANATKYAATDIYTSDLSLVKSEAVNGTVLDLGQYLQYMPNFLNFLKANPIVFLSLVNSVTTDSNGNVTGVSMYIAPYFDGNDDIERYCLIRQDWASKLLDGDLTSDGDTFKSVCATSTSATSYMGGNNYSVDTTDPSDVSKTYKLTKDYEAAKKAAANTTTALGAAYSAIANAAYAGESGNIVDIMNAALAANNEATGKQLATLFREYIDVAYASANYGTTRSDLFNGVNAAWDVDDLVAMLRVVKTNSANLGIGDAKTVGIFPRSSLNDRTPDIVRLVGDLYGVRGTDSRLDYDYISEDGTLKDSRQDTKFYDALLSFKGLADEQLVVDYYGEGGSATDKLTTNQTDSYKLNNTTAGSTVETLGFMEYDYSQTQSNQMFDADNSEYEISKYSDYLFAAINNPVAKWDVNEDGQIDYASEIFRFTESWRSTKTSGLAVHLTDSMTGEKLAATLTFIDYLYSDDGQITSTYGIQSTNGNTNANGTWYGKEVGSLDANGYYNGEKVADVVKAGTYTYYNVTEDAKSKYFVYNGKVYTGTSYKGAQTPVVTTELYDSFSTDKSGIISAQSTAFKSSRKSFTDYARKILGATLPVGVKSQSFENQLTATAASAAATKVSYSIANGTIRHVWLKMTGLETGSEYYAGNWWYTSVPTQLPYSDAEQSVLDSSDLKNLKSVSAVTTKANYALYHHLIFKGLSGTYTGENSVSINFSNI